MIGTSIARYDILEELGQGGMSVVYLARDTALNRQVAVKVLHEHLAKKAENRKRFRREAEAIARLQHPNILDVYDVSDESDERSFIVMEYIPGMNLRQFLERHCPPPPEAAALIGVEICNALTHAHDHGVIHRDLKPENVMISEDGQVKLMDFGIAHVIDAETMTKTGSLLGSPAHMAPELIDGQPVDERADVFALGTVLYWMSTGELPFCGDNAPQVLRNVMECRYEEPEIVEPTIGHDLGRIICKSLKKEPQGRFSSVDTVKRELLAAVHAVGFDEDNELVRDYFDDPIGFTDAFPELIIGRLITRAKRALDRRNVPSAIAYFNRVLAYDPGNEEVAQCLNQLNRSRRMSRVAGVLAGLAVIGAVGWLVVDTGADGDESIDEPAANAVAGALIEAQSTTGAFASLADRLDEAHRQARAEIGRQSSALAARNTAVSVARRARTTAAESRRRPLQVAPMQPTANTPVDARLADAAESGDDRGADTEEQVTHEVRFNLFPKSANLEINGEPIEAWYKGVQLPEGTHRIKVSADGCTTYWGRLEVNGPREEKVVVTLDWRDAQIEVLANKDVLVFVGKDLKSRGRRGTIPVRFERRQKPERHVTLHIRDVDDPREVKSRTVTLAPGDEHTVNVNF